jgi:hypothetical protein
LGAWSACHLGASKIRCNIQGCFGLALQARILQELNQAGVSNIPTLWHEGQLTQTLEPFFIVFPFGAGVDFSLAGWVLLRIVRDVAATLGQMHRLCQVGAAI